MGKATRAIAVLAMVLAGAAPACARDAVTLTVLSTNDFHGALDGIDDPELAGAPARMGGLDRLAGMVAKLRRDAPGPTILVDAGDCFRGVMAVDAAEGAPCARMFNLMRYDAVGLGNHEFDYLDCGRDDPTVAAKEPQCALKRVLAAARYPVVATNLVDAATGKAPDWPGLKPWVVVDAGGVKVGIAAVLTTNAAMVTSPGAMAGLKLTDPSRAVRDAVPRMREAGADAIVVLAHLTGACRGRDEGEAGGEPDCAVTGDLGRLADALKGYADLVVSGHSHVLIAGGRQAVPVMEAGAQGRFVGRARIGIDRAAGRSRPARVEVLPPVPMCRAEDDASMACGPRWRGWEGVAAPDPEAARLLAELDASVAGVCDEVVATAIADIVQVRGPESPLANLTADLMRRAGTVAAGGSGPAEIAFTNQGGVRDSLRAGPITACDLHRVWPFEDPLYEVSMTGAELTELFRFVTGKIRKSFAISGATVDRPGKDAVLKDAEGRPLDPARTYRVVTSNYLIRGGDRADTVLGRLPPERFRKLSYPSYREAFRRILGAMGTVEPPPLGRVTRK
jgi:2',3'-cyclic-nucleotide 2'-phosphodiesterase (5'-nucleotidase family)